MNRPSKAKECIKKESNRIKNGLQKRQGDGSAVGDLNNSSRFNAENQNGSNGQETGKERQVQSEQGFGKGTRLHQVAL